MGFIGLDAVQHKSHLEQSEKKSEQCRLPQKWPFWGDIHPQGNLGHFRNILGHFWPFSPSDPIKISKNHSFWNSSFRLRQLIETYAPVQDQCASIHPSMVLPWSIHPSMVQTEGRIVTLSIAHHRPPNHYDASTVNLPSLPFPSMSPILSDILILTKTKDIYDRIIAPIQ